MQIAAPYDGWLIWLVGLGGAWLVAWAWVRALGRGLSLLRQRRFEWAQVGDRLEERFILQNSAWVPGLWVEVSDYSNLPGYNAGRATGVARHGQNEWHTSGVCQRRGVFHLGPTGLRSADPLGLFEVYVHDAHSATLVVMPPVIALPWIHIDQNGRDSAGRPRRTALESSLHNGSVRAYLPGDSLRQVHWPTSARQAELYVRLLEATPCGDWWILLDLQADCQAGQGQENSSEHGVILAASLADLGLRQHQAVGLAINGRPLVWLPPRPGDGQRWEILRSLAEANPGQPSLAEVLRRMRSAFSRRSALIIITADIHADWLPDLLALTQTGIIPTLLLLDPASYTGGEHASGQLHALQARLTQHGLQHQVVPCQAFDRLEARPGQAGAWDWRVSPTGRAIAVRRPGDLTWRTLE